MVHGCERQTVKSRYAKTRSREITVAIVTFKSIFNLLLSFTIRCIKRIIIISSLFLSHILPLPPPPHYCNPIHGSHKFAVIFLFRVNPIRYGLSI